MINKSVMSERAPDPVGPYPHARIVGDFLFLSGVGPRRLNDKQIPGVTLNADGGIESYDIETQCKAVFENVKAIVEDAGSSLNKIVDITIFLTNMDDDFRTFNRIYRDYFGQIQPCRTTLEVNKLPTPIAIELKVIAIA